MAMGKEGGGRPRAARRRRRGTPPRHRGGGGKSRRGKGRGDGRRCWREREGLRGEEKKMKNHVTTMEVSHRGNYLTGAEEKTVV
jgi:hypothetical protein